MRHATLALSAAALLVLAGCSAGGETDAEVDPDTSATETAPEPAPIDPFDPACLVGDWVVTEQEMQSFYDAIMGETEGLTFTVAGSAGLGFTEAEYRWTPEFTLTLEIVGAEGKGVTTGTLGGTWTASGGVITTSVGDNNLSVDVTVNGVTQDGSDLLGSIINSDPINDTPFDCSNPDAPVLQFETATDRTPVVLARAG